MKVDDWYSIFAGKESKDQNRADFLSKRANPSKKYLGLVRRQFNELQFNQES